MNGHNVHTNNAILFSLKREGNPDTCHSMDEHWGHYSKWHKPDIKGQVLYSYSHDVMAKFTETESRMVVVRSWGRRECEGLLSNGLSTSVLMKKVLWMDGGDGSPTMWMYFMPWTAHLRLAKDDEILCYPYFIILKKTKLCIFSYKSHCVSQSIGLFIYFPHFLLVSWSFHWFAKALCVSCLPLM